jgi:hypothetical protein
VCLLPGRADGYPSGPPTDPYVRNSRIRFLKQSCGCPCKDTLAPPSTGLPWSGFVSSKSLPCLPPADALLDGAFPPVGRLGLTSPPSSVLCAATTAALPVSGSFTCRSFPDTLPASVVRGVPYGLMVEWKPPTTPGPLVTRSPTPGICARRQVALPSSRVPPMAACPALRPRWCPRHSPYRVQDCCLPALAHRRLSPRYLLRDILLSTTIHLSGLNHAACVLATPGFVRPLTGRHAGSLLTGWLGVRQVGLAPEVLTYWATATHFIGFLLLPRFRAYLGASKALLGLAPN